MSDAKSTNLNVREDRPTALSSSAHGSNLNAIGFNIIFIAARKPKLAEAIIKVYAEAHSIKPNDPLAPEEDFKLFADKIAELFSGDVDDN